MTFIFTFVGAQGSIGPGLSELIFLSAICHISNFFSHIVGHPGDQGQKGQQGDQGFKGFKGQQGPVVSREM
jgi:hypothetical protein